MTITVKSEDGGKSASCKVKVLRRKQYKLKAGAKYTFNSRLGREHSMDVMYQNSEKNTNVSLYKTTSNRNAQIFTAEQRVVNGKTCWALIRTNKYVTKRAVTELNGKNIVFAASSGEIVCNQAPCGDPISSSSVATSSSSGTTAIAPRAIRHDSQARKAYRDLKGRSFDKQIPYRVMF
ncbi:hypothetical protein [Fibrobacter succinogenes]|uniref:Ig-like domain-containing protein n=1 Tax=Fibrobacter succinogenes TaxID=833 RepID=UPI0013D3CE51|nr:hypothetical protein [Fibrobacter succinogenes]